MQFNNETERMAHPQAGLIPASLWRDKALFDYALPDALLPLMQAADEGDLRPLLEQLPNLIRGRWRLNKCAWLAIAISHPNLSNETLVTLADQLELDRNDLFETAIYWGKVHFFDYLSTQYETTAIQKMITADNYGAFRKASSNGHLEVVNRLVVIYHDHLNAINRLISRLLGYARPMIAADYYEAFRGAAANGYLWVVNRLVELSGKRKARLMIEAYDYQAFYQAATNGHLEVINRLVELSPGDVQAMIAARDYEAFRGAAANGHLEVINRLVELSPGDVQVMIAANNYAPFRLAAGNGHLEVVNRLAGLASGNLQAMIAADDYAAFSKAAEGGHLHVVNRLVELSPGNVQTMIESVNYKAFRLAAGNGHLEVINRLLELAPGNVQVMIAAYDYTAFCYAAGNGHLNVMNRLVELSPGNVQAMIAANGYMAFYWASRDGYLEVVNRLLELSPGNVHAMIAASDYEAFRCAARDGHLEVVNRLLSFPSALVYAEMHEREYREQYVHLFINDKLALLSKEIALAKQENSSVEFDIADPEEAKLYFYVIRNLIRRNESALLDNIRLLLDIPAVRALAHKEVTPGMPNELLRLAMSTGNWAAAVLLVLIPAIDDLAAQNDYYLDEILLSSKTRQKASCFVDAVLESKEHASNAGLASEAGFFANTSARQELERGVTNSPRVTL